MKRVSIKDVATLADTSPATVSKVLNDVADSGIPPDTAERVRWAARKLHYVPLSSAQSLRRRRTQTIGFITYELTGFTTEITTGIEAAARAHELTTVLGVHNEDNDLEAKHLLMGLRGQVDGLIILPARSNRNQALYDELKERRVPFVFVDRYIPGYEADYVGVQNEQAAYRLTRTLIAQGADVIGNIHGVSGNTALEERVAGYRRALAEARLPQDEDLCMPTTGEGRAEALRRLITRRPPVNGLFWTSYVYIQPFLAILAAQGIRVPEDLRIAGFDMVSLSLSRREDYQAMQAIHEPWPAAIQPAYEMGSRALDILAQHLAGAAPKAPQHVLLEPRYEWLAE